MSDPIGIFVEALLSRTPYPPAARTAAAQRIVDIIGGSLVAATEGEGTAPMRAALRRPGGTAQLWGAGTATTEAAWAALANGTLAHALEFDDTHTGSVMHPGAVVVPTALAVAAETGAPGHDVLDAIVAGYEAAIRLGELSPGTFQTRGFQGTAILGPFVAALVAGRLRRLDPELVIAAWGVAGSMASGINEFHRDGSKVKQLHPGWAAHNGLRSLELAEFGATGPRSVIEGRAGIFASFAGVEVNLDPILDGLGERVRIGEVSTKPYPVCHCIHAPLDAWFRLDERLGGVEPESIRRLTCLIPEWYVGVIVEPVEVKRVPSTPYMARFSLVSAMARAVLDGTFGPDSFAAGSFTQPEVRRLAERIDHRVEAFPEFPEFFPGGVEVELADGTVHRELVRHNRGSRLDPLTVEDLHHKSRVAADRLGTPEAAEHLIVAVDGLADAPDLSALTEALAAFDVTD